MAGFMDNYQTVQERIDIFWRLNPNGRFTSEIVAITDKEVIVKSSVWTDQDKVAPTAVDFAQESVITDGKMAGMHVELAVTSALGRAISQLGGELSPDKKKASQTEMEKAKRVTTSRLISAATEAFANGDLDALRNIYQSAFDQQIDSAAQTHIRELGAALSKKNAPVGKENKTTEAQAEASLTAKTASKENLA